MEQRLRIRTYLQDVANSSPNFEYSPDAALCGALWVALSARLLREVSARYSSDQGEEYDVPRLRLGGVHRVRRRVGLYSRNGVK